MNTTLPQDSQLRKEYPLFRGLLRYFPAALAGVARHSKVGNDKHNPGEEMHHARGKSNDHADCILRHTMDLSDLEAAIERFDGHPDDAPGAVQALLTEADALVWRASAWSQQLYEKYGGAPLAPGARLTPAETVKRAQDSAITAAEMGVPASVPKPEPIETRQHLGRMIEGANPPMCDSLKCWC